MKSSSKKFFSINKEMRKIREHREPKTCAEIWRSKVLKKINKKS